MNFDEMTVAELEARRAEIAAEVDNEGADLDALETEARAIKDELETRKAAEAKKVEVRKIVAEGAGAVVESAPKSEVNKMSIDEIRGSSEYAEAYKNYIITNDDTECRKLLSQNAASGANYVPVPVIVDATVRTAWERNELLNRVNRTTFRGNFKAYFELSADGAYEHTEGSSAPTEEALTLGVITMVPKNTRIPNHRNANVPMKEMISTSVLIQKLE